MKSNWRKNIKYQKDPNTKIIIGAEPFKVGKGKKAILMIHGWSSSPRDFKYLSEALKTKYVCHGILLKGNGSEPDNLNKYTWKDHLDQVYEEYQLLCEKYSEVTVIGFSYGATLGLHLAARRKIKSLILICPFFKSPKSIGGFVRLSDLVPYVPGIIKSIPKSGQGPIINQEELKEHICYHTQPMKSLKSVINCVKELMKVLPKVFCPTLIIHSLHDTTASFDAAVKCLKLIGSVEKTLTALENSNHVVTLDNDRNIVESQISNWLAVH